MRQPDIDRLIHQVVCANRLHTNFKPDFLAKVPEYEAVYLVSCVLQYAVYICFSIKEAMVSNDVVLSEVICVPKLYIVSG